MRGEKRTLGKEKRKSQGSPPHARGKVNWLNDSEGKARITPACAGKRLTATTVFTPDKDHPRMRGEKSKGIGYLSIKEGSPPHARGKVQ